jgi:hypothetical protein
MVYLNKCLVSHFTSYGDRNRGSRLPSGGSSVLHLHHQQNMKNKYNYLNWDEWYWFTSISRSEVVSTITSEVEAKDRLFNLLARDMAEKSWSTSKRELSACSHSRHLIRLACCQEISSTSPTLSLHCCSGTSRIQINSNKIFVCTYKKIRSNI